MSTGDPAGPSDTRPLAVLAGPMWLLISVLVVALFALVGVFWLLNEHDIFLADIALPMLLLAGAVVFLGAVLVLATVYTRLGLKDGKHALGLPEGSVRAIIALVLVFLFFVAATFIYFSLARAPERTLTGITPGQYAQIPVADLISSSPRPETTPTAYDVVVRGAAPQASEDVGKNLIVLLGTLITAVVAFYFGANAVSSATAAGSELRGPGRERGIRQPDGGTEEKVRKDGETPPAERTAEEEEGQVLTPDELTAEQAAEEADVGDTEPDEAPDPSDRNESGFELADPDELEEMKKDAPGREAS